jgi:hypothetical protein
LSSSSISVSFPPVYFDSSGFFYLSSYCSGTEIPIYFTSSDGKIFSSSSSSSDSYKAIFVLPTLTSSSSSFFFSLFSSSSSLNHSISFFLELRNSDSNLIPCDYLFDSVSDSNSFVDSSSSSFSSSTLFSDSSPSSPHNPYAEVHIYVRKEEEEEGNEREIIFDSECDPFSHRMLYSSTFSPFIPSSSSQKYLLNVRLSDNTKIVNNIDEDYEFSGFFFFFFSFFIFFYFILKPFF